MNIQAARIRLAATPASIQTVKVTNCISNARTIFKHDPRFAVVYCREIRELAQVLVAADPFLRGVLMNILDNPTAKEQA